ncbi:MAG TPA: histidine phosphatase family protein [bacterium]|nr:histidine phosphatase family protein [bacterium]
MRLWLIRHGECDSFSSDPAGPALTSAGLADVESMATRMAGMESRPRRLFCSPLLRARQSAVPFAALWDLAPEIADWLLPETGVAQLLAQLQASGEESVALVGHMPSLGLLLAALIWGLPLREAVVPRAAVAFLEVSAWEPGGGRLEWLRNPEENR